MVTGRDSQVNSTRSDLNIQQQQNMVGLETMKEAIFHQVQNVKNYTERVFTLAEAKLYLNPV